MCCECICELARFPVIYLKHLVFFTLLFKNVSWPWAELHEGGTRVSLLPPRALLMNYISRKHPWGLPGPRTLLED